MKKSLQNLKKWPKIFPPLSEERQKINDDFVHYWHEVLPKKYGFVDRFNHSYVVNHAPKNFKRTLEVGAGNGEHLKYEKLSKMQSDQYFALDIRQNMIDELRKSFPNIHAIVGDCQKRIDFPDNYFDRILAIHVLEHLPDLPAAVNELHRLCNKEGVLSIVIPCEGSFAYSLARKVSAQRIFEARYKQSYDWFIEREHINVPNEIFEELSVYFQPVQSSYYPFPVKNQTLNLCIGATLKPLEIC